MSEPRRGMLVIACGALAREIAALRRANGWTHLDVRCLPAELHNRPERIARGRARDDPRAARRLRARSSSPTATAAPAARSTRCSRRKASSAFRARIATSSSPTRRVFAALADAEPGTFYLTDFLLRAFRPPGDPRPRPRPPPGAAAEYFGNYRRLVYLAQVATPERIERGARDRDAPGPRHSSTASPATATSARSLRARWPRRRTRPHGQADRHLLARHSRAGRRQARPRDRQGAAVAALPGGGRPRRDARRQGQLGRLPRGLEAQRRRAPAATICKAEAAAAAARLEARYHRRGPGAADPRQGVDEPACSTPEPRRRDA